MNIRFLPTVLLFLLLAPQAEMLAAQAVPRVPVDTVQVRARTTVRDAHDAQRRFEIDRVRWLPATASLRYGRCDEVLGRMCLRDNEGDDWYPGPEDPRIARARDELLEVLAAAEGLGDPWVLGQRVVYLGEAGRWDEAHSLAVDACRGGEGDGWCSALEGLTLHALGRFQESESAFRRALVRMDAERARVWNDPEPLLDSEGRAWWRGLSEAVRADRAGLVWAFADPFLLVPGNDGLTEVWSRWTVTEIRAGARNAYGMAWGSDLEQLTVRYGWEVGWEREEARPLGPRTGGAVVGRHHPESRPLLPEGAVFGDPAAASEQAWIPDASRPRSGYASAYAPTVLPGAGQLAIFPRGDRFVLVGALALPEDTTFHAKHGHPDRERASPPWRGRASEAGLFLIPADGQGTTLAVRALGREQGGFTLEAPAGRWVASLEVMAPERRRAGRTRTGVVVAATPLRQATLSDLLLVDMALPDGASLEDAAARALPRDWLAHGERLAIAWELFGLGYRAESLSYRLTVEKMDGGLLRRAGRWLRILGSPRVRRLAWEEVGPERPGPVLRSVEVDLPELDPGSYEVRLEVRSPQRAPLVQTRALEVRR